MQSKTVKELSFTGRVGSQGRVTIPDPIRSALDIKKGNLVHVRIEKIKDSE